jgi:UDP-3-O-[3-hydroxymyristoyl] glucosamine N-acyltransferase
LKLRDISERLDCRLEGDGDLEIQRVTTLERAVPGDLTFFANPRYAQALRQTGASAVILDERADAAPCAMLRTRNPYLAFARAMEMFAERWRPAPGVHRLAHVADDATIGAGAWVGPFAVIGEGAIVGSRTLIYPHVTIGRGARLGADCVVHARVSIREHVQIGDRVVLQDGAVVGSDGYGFAQRADGSHEKIPQTAPVVIEDDVEIGANTTIDRPAVGETRIKAGTKIDNLVQIGHGVVLGKNVLLAAQVGIAGSTVVGDNVQFGGQAGAAGHLTIGDRVKAAARAAIFSSVGDDAFVSGTPAIDHGDWRRSSAVFSKLPELRRKLQALEERLRRLEENKE